MFRRSTKTQDPDPQQLTPAETALLSQPHDTCFRCGGPTPPGVSLCDRDNPGHIKSPSSTQVHGTILVGVIAGFIALALVFGATSAGAGPFTANVSGVATRPDGGLDVVMRVANSGTRASGASCRVSPDGAPDYRDYVFFTEPIPAGESREFARSLEAPANGRALSPANVAVRCN
jgi:hypothetical protein